MTTDRAAKIEALLRSAFTPDYLLVKDQSHLHAGHAGATDGRGHFDVTIVANDFSACSRLQAHRLVYAAVGDLMQTDVHALSIRASAMSDDNSDDKPA